MDSKVKRRFNILAIIGIIIICFATAPIGLQNDTFYTVSIGEHIMDTGTIDMKDPFSWHENLKYTYPHWLYDVGMYLIYNLGGWDAIYLSTIVLSCILGITIYLANTKICKNNLISFILTIGVIYECKPYIAARAQLVTFILFVLTIFFIEKFLENRKMKYAVFLVVTATLIANLHSAVWPFFFVLFLPYIAEYLICIIVDANLVIKVKLLWNTLLSIIFKKNTEKLDNINENISELKEKDKRIKCAREKNRKNPYKLEIEKNKNVRFLIIICLVCTLTGLLTPLGDVPYTYLKNTNDGITTENINEHLPVILIESKEFLCILLTIAALLIFTKVKIKLRDVLFIGGLLILALMSRRQISMFLLIGIYTVNRIITNFVNQYKAAEEIENITSFITTKTGLTFFTIIFILVGIKIYKPKLESNEEYISKSSYPVDACDYILNSGEIDLNTAKFYNEYNYGSYMLYRGIPVFIDSRADLYSPEFNEGVNVFADFLNISNMGVYYEDKLEEYGITHLIMYKDAKLNTFFISRNPEYKKLYEDDYFIIYKRPVKETQEERVDVVGEDQEQ